MSMLSVLSGRGAVEADSSSFFASPLATPTGVYMVIVGQVLLFYSVTRHRQRRLV
jgi:hypothetical protein